MAALALLICACGGKNAKSGSGGTGGFLQPSSTGVPYEILIVSDPENFQNGVVDAAFQVMDDDIPGLPQPESAFRVSKVTTPKFVRTLRLCRNILIVNVDRTYTQPKMKFSRNVYASPQMVMTIQAPDERTFIDYMNTNGRTVVDFFTKAEMNREIELLRKKHNVSVEERVMNLFGCDVWIPEELNKTKVGQRFFWATTDRGQRDMSFVIYSYPYKDTDTFTPEYFLNMRDSVMQANIPGPRDGQYMQTARSFVTVTDSEVHGEYAQIARGLWEMKDYDMGGPFVSVGRVDEKNGSVVVAEAFVYAPGDMKKNLIRRMEAALYTLQLPDEIDERNIAYSIEEIEIKPEE